MVEHAIFTKTAILLKLKTGLMTVIDKGSSYTTHFIDGDYQIMFINNNDYIRARRVNYYYYDIFDWTLELVVSGFGVDRRISWRQVRPKYKSIMTMRLLLIKEFILPDLVPVIILNMLGDISS